MELEKKRFNLNYFDNGDIITIISPITSKAEHWYYDGSVFNDNPIANITLKGIFWDFRKNNKKLPVNPMTRFYSLAYQNDKPFIIGYGKQMYEMLVKSCIDLNPDDEIFPLEPRKLGIMDVNIHIEMVDIGMPGHGGHKLPSLEKSVLSISNKKYLEQNITEHIDSVKEYLSDFPTWDENNKLLQYLNEVGVDINELIIRNREENINRILQEI